VKTALLGLVLVVGASAAASFPAYAENAMYSCEDANGVVELTNVPQGTNCEKLFSYTAPVQVAAPAVQPVALSAQAAQMAALPAPAASSSASVRTEARAKPAPVPAAAATPRSASKSLLAQRRDDVIQQTREAYAAGQAMAGANPAVNRRYLMTSRVEYQKAIGAIQ
jgi:hypothetical protein